MDNLVYGSRFYESPAPVIPSPEQPPLAPYDPPDPAPQAAAWRRALKVVTARSAARHSHAMSTSDHAVSTSDLD